MQITNTNINTSYYAQWRTKQPQLCCVQFLKRDQAVAAAGSKEGAILYSLINGAQLNNTVCDY